MCMFVWMNVCVCVNVCVGGRKRDRWRVGMLGYFTRQHVVLSANSLYDRYSVWKHIWKLSSVIHLLNVNILPLLMGFVISYLNLFIIMLFITIYYSCIYLFYIFFYFIDLFQIKPGVILLDSPDNRLS